MAKQKTQKLELATLDAKNIVELDGWKEKQESVIKENPFIEIVDRETYETAKSRRTALVSARREIQKQDKLIGSVVSSFRKQTMEIAKELIDITQPHEEKQQSEVSRHEEILEAKRQEKELAEQRRIDLIKDSIGTFQQLMNDHLDLMTFENLDDTKSLMEDQIANFRENNFEEFEPIFDDVLNNIQLRHDERRDHLVLKENERLEQLEKDQYAKINSIYREGSTIIDQANELIDGHSFIRSLNKLFDFEFDFGKYNEEYEQTKKDLIFKAKEKQESLESEMKRREEIKLQEQRNRINNVREGLLDRIFQMDPDNHQVDLEFINGALTQENPFPELEDKFNTMVETVKKNLDSKMKMINTELEQRKQEAIDARIAIDARTAQRGKQLEKIGFIFNEQKTENFWNTLVLDFEVWESMVEGLSDEDWTPYFNKIKKSMEDANKENKAHQERQKRLKLDKQRMTEFVLQLPIALTTDYEFENNESVQLFLELQGQLDMFVKSKIETINKF